MKDIDTPTSRISVVEDNVVLIRAREGVIIDGEQSRHANKLIADAVPGNYGIIIDRKEDYSIVPAEVYEILNSMDRLKAIAIVTHRDSSFTFALVEKPFYHGHFKVFSDMEEARAWIKKVLEV